MLLWRLMAVAAVLVPAAAQAAVDCRIRSMPPASYVSKPLPAVKMNGLPLAKLQRLYRHLAGLPARASGLGYCGDPLGFVFPWNGAGAQTLYYPTDVSTRCQREVIEHELAHVKGWPMNHPDARTQVGPCRAANG